MLGKSTQPRRATCWERKVYGITRGVARKKVAKSRASRLYGLEEKLSQRYCLTSKIVDYDVIKAVSLFGGKQGNYTVGQIKISREIFLTEAFSYFEKNNIFFSNGRMKHLIWINTGYFYF